MCSAGCGCIITGAKIGLKLGNEYKLELYTKYLSKTVKAQTIKGYSII